MKAIDVLNNIIQNDNLLKYPFKYCLVSSMKVPFTINGTVARPNVINDFVDISKLVESKVINNFDGIGISIKGSNICAIDIDKCFTEPFNLSTGDSRAIDIINLFKDNAYIEFSFSGKGLRIFFILVKLSLSVLTFSYSFFSLL